MSRQAWLRPMLGIGSYQLVRKMYAVETSKVLGKRLESWGF